jgi:hypothetical protein
MDNIEYYNGPRYIDGVNLDVDIVSAHAKVQFRNISDPVSDGSLGNYGYAPGQKNLDGSDL